jgi:hypothetical protein
MDADPTVYDNFNNPAYDGSYRDDLWVFSTDDPEASATQGDGVLKLSVSAGEAVRLTLRHYNGFILETPIFFEARFRLGPARGPYHYLLGFRDQLSTVFSADCSILVDPEQPNLHCKWNEPNALVATEPMDVARRTWYTLRIEVDPSTMEFTYFVDGQQVLAEVPASADRLMTSQFELDFAIWNYSESSETAIVYLDDVRVGPAE